MRFLRAIFILLRFVWGDIVYRFREDRIWREYNRDIALCDNESMGEAIARREQRLERLKWEGR